MPACEAQNPAKRFKPPTFCNWLPYIFDMIVNQIVLTVPEAGHRFGIRGIMRISFGKLYAA